MNAPSSLPPALRPNAAPAASRRPAPLRRPARRPLPTLLPALALLLATVVAAPAQQVREASGATPAELRELSARAKAAFDSARWEAAAGAYGKLVELVPDSGEAWHRLGYSLHAQQRLDEALKAHERASRLPGFEGIGAYNAACVHALRGRKDEAFAWLEKARSHGFGDARQLDGDPDLAALRDDPRYAKLKDSLATMPRRPRAVVQSSTRRASRLLYFDQDGPGTQVVIDHGQPAWKPEYEQAVEAADRVGRRWRLGTDFWTTLDTNAALRIAGIEVPPGSYYLTVHRAKDGRFVLALNDPAVIRAQKLDAFLAERSSGGIEVPLVHERQEELAERLQIELATVAGEQGAATLAIRFGPHRLTAPIAIELGGR